MSLVGRAALLIEVNGLVAGSACNDECTHGAMSHTYSLAMLSFVMVLAW